MLVVNLLMYLLLKKSLIVKVECFSVEAFHNFMTDDELAYYFHTDNKRNVPEYEIVYLPQLQFAEKDDQNNLKYKFSAFKRDMSLNLKQNSELMSPNFKMYVNNENDEKIAFHQNNSQESCHFLHKDENLVAAISFCRPNAIQGILVLDNTTLELHPLTPRLQNVVLQNREPLVDEFILDDDTEPYLNNIPHIIKRAQYFETSKSNNIQFPTAGNVLPQNHYIKRHFDSHDMETQSNFFNVRASHRPVGGMTLELAMFFDEAAYKIFAPNMGYDMKQIVDMLLAYLNGVQALYHHPSLGTTLKLVLVRLDVMKKQPSDMPHYNGERSMLLDSFCYYQDDLNTENDEDPEHWDMALYISGLDFYAIERGKKNGATMGLATVGGVCFSKYACVIAELGTTNVFGKPYPSAGFTSVYILAHEIGHNLGMHHDSIGNTCPKEGYIMSPSRGTNGETVWSTCSADVMSKLSWAKCLQDSSLPPKHLDHSKFLNNPGRAYTAKKQCEILLQDKDAVVSPSQELSKICYNLQCKTPHRSGYYFAGPALDGTECDKRKYCFGGECVSRTLPNPVKVTPGGWSPWKQGTCHSDCIEKSKGYTTKTRACNNPAPVNTDKGCEGIGVDFGLCNDEKICKPTNRVSVIDYASRKCKEFSRLLPELDSKGAGLQAPHEELRVWMGCAIFCKREDSRSYYTPRIELNDLGVSPYFPDGTWCHREHGSDFYCIHHHCLPEHFVFPKSKFPSLIYGIGDEIPFSQNAHPNEVIPPALRNYLSLNPNGKPVTTFLRPEDAKKTNEDWELNDYIEVPELEDLLNLIIE